MTVKGQLLDTTETGGAGSVTLHVAEQAESPPQVFFIRVTHPNRGSSMLRGSGAPFPFRHGTWDWNRRPWTRTDWSVAWPCILAVSRPPPGVRTVRMVTVPGRAGDP